MSEKITRAQFVHLDALDAKGRPVVLEDGGRSGFLPTPCCGAPASVSADFGMYCKSCYGEVDYIYGDAPERPFTVLMSVVFDVTDFTEAERDALYGEVVVQGECNDDHPEAVVVPVKGGRVR